MTQLCPPPVPPSESGFVRHISFTIKEGETIALVGPSGSGKSTVSRMLMGLNEPVSGQLLFNDVEVRELDLDDLRAQLSIVPQEAQLFYGTIRDNLKFYNPLAADNDCIQALERAGSLSYFRELGLDLDTFVGERGITLSAGERQRLAIARSFLRNPNVIIFDEATSSLDSFAEGAVTTAIKSLREAGSRMIILISHKLSTVMSADKIFVFENGRIVEMGNHKQLIMQNGLYSAMWRLQVGGKHSTAPISLKKVG